MTSDKKLAHLAELEGILDTFGGDPSRWPAGRRERMIGFAASDSDARRLLHEAKALDAVLSRAAGPPVGDTSRLAERIAAAVAGSAHAGATIGAADRGDRAMNVADDHAGADKAGVVIAWPHSAPAARLAAPSAASAPRRVRPIGHWRTGAMLAASLLVGVFVGMMDLVPYQVSQLVAGVEASETTQAIAFLQGDGLLDLLDEGPL